MDLDCKNMVGEVNNRRQPRSFLYFGFFVFRYQKAGPLLEDELPPDDPLDVVLDLAAAIMARSPFGLRPALLLLLLRVCSRASALFQHSERLAQSDLLSLQLVVPDDDDRLRVVLSEREREESQRRDRECNTRGKPASESSSSSSVGLTLGSSWKSPNLRPATKLEAKSFSSAGSFAMASPAPSPYRHRRPRAPVTHESIQILTVDGAQ